MRRGWLFLWAGLAVFGLGMLAVYLAMPRVVSLQPAPHARDAPGNTSIRIQFSRRMDAASVTERFEIEPPRGGEITWENNTLVFSPDQPWQGGETVRVRLGKGATAQGFPRWRLAQEVDWSFQVRNPLLLYLYPFSAPASLYLINPVSGEVEVMYEGEEVLDYSLGFNGRIILFSTRQGNASTLYELERETKEAKPMRRFDRGLVRAAQLSPSGEYVAYEYIDLSESAANAHVWLLRMDGSTDTPPIRLPDEGGSAQHPAWSSQNILAYYDSAGERYRFYDPNSGVEVKSVASQTGEKGAWAGDGLSFLFPEILSDDETQIPASHLLRFDLNTGQVDYLTQKKNAEDTAPAFSPDNRRLVFARKFLDPLQWTPGRQIWMMELETGEVYPVLQEAQYHHYSFVWSPDSAQIAYLRFNQMSPTEPPELWIINADGTQPRQLITGGYAPQWLP